MKKSSRTTVDYPAVFSPAEEGGYVVTFPDFPGCVTEGDTFEEARANAVEVLELWLEELSSQKHSLPRHGRRPIVDEVEVSLPASGWNSLHSKMSSGFFYLTALNYLDKKAATAFITIKRGAWLVYPSGPAENRLNQVQPEPSLNSRV